MSHHSQIEEAEAEIDRMSTELANLQSEIETSARRNYTSNPFEQPPPLRLFDETLEPSDRRTRNDRPSRKKPKPGASTEKNPFTNIFCSSTSLLNATVGQMQKKP